MQILREGVSQLQRPVKTETLAQRRSACSRNREQCDNWERGKVWVANAIRIGARGHHTEPQRPRVGGGILPETSLQRNKMNSKSISGPLRPDSMTVSASYIQVNFFLSALSAAVLWPHSCTCLNYVSFPCWTCNSTHFKNKKFSLLTTGYE